MRDDFEFIDLCMYLFGVVLILPAFTLLDRNSVLLKTLFLLLLAPSAVFMVRMRYAFPSRLDQIIEKLAHFTFLVGVFIFLAFIGVTAVRWII